MTLHRIAVRRLVNQVVSLVANFRKYRKPHMAINSSSPLWDAFQTETVHAATKQLITATSPHCFIVLFGFFEMWVEASTARRSRGRVKAKSSSGRVAPIHTERFELNSNTSQRTGSRPRYSRVYIHRNNEFALMSDRGNFKQSSQSFFSRGK